MTAMKALKDATWTIHKRLEKRLAIKNRFSELGLYREHIAKLEAFHRDAEAVWGHLLEQALPDLPARRKTELLAKDMEVVGGTPIMGAPIPVISDVPSALGAFYVLEGATLGGQHLLPLIETKLGLSASRGASFFASYGSQVKAMWALFGQAVEKHCEPSDATRSAVAAAESTFLAMEAWLCREQS